MSDIFEEVIAYKEIGVSYNSLISDAINLHKNIFEEGNSYVEGQSFEKTEDVQYMNIKYIIVDSYTNEILKVVNSTDGKFNIGELTDNRNVNIIAIDLNNKYTGKYLNDISPSVDSTSIANIILVSKFKNGKNYSFNINIKYHGEPQVTISSQVSGLILEKENDHSYWVKGNNINANNVEFEFVLDDYIEGVPNRVTKLIKYGV